MRRVFNPPLDGWGEFFYPPFLILRQYHISAIKFRGYYLFHHTIYCGYYSRVTRVAFIHYTAVLQSIASFPGCVGGEKTSSLLPRGLGTRLSNPFPRFLVHAEFNKKLTEKLVLLQPHHANKLLSALLEVRLLSEGGLKSRVAFDRGNTGLVWLLYYSSVSTFTAAPAQKSVHKWLQ